MADVIKFDLMGHRRLEFDDVSLTHISNELYPVPLPGSLGVGQVVTNRAIAFADVRWVGPIRKRQWWALIIGILGVALGLFWMVTTFNKGEWGPFGFGAGFTLLLGVLPLGIFVRGRTFLAVVSASEMICLPMDRKRRQIRKAVDILRKHCQRDGVDWHLD